MDTAFGADADRRLIGLWLHRRPATTARAYRRDAELLLAYVGRPLAELTLDDLQRFADSLEGLAPASRRRTISAVRHLLRFGHEAGLLPANVGTALRPPRVKNALAERLLTEEETRAVIAAAAEGRDRALLRLLYAGGLRVSEAVGLRWRDLRGRGELGGQITVFGKGGKTRAIVIGPEVWRCLLALRGERGAGAPVFASARGRALSSIQAWRIVRAAAEAAGVGKAVSPHWLRHAHASHALARGASPALVKATLGHSSLAVTDVYLHVTPEESSALFVEA